MRLAVYTNDAYRERDGRVYAEQAFPLFLLALARHGDDVVVAGRVDPEPGPCRYEMGGVEFAALPHHPSLSEPIKVIAAVVRSLPQIWSLTGRADALWLMGPLPMALAFVACAFVQRKRIVLGVRQDFLAYVRHRRSGQRLFRLAALLLEKAWRALSRRYPTIVVGPELASIYSRAPRLLEIVVSLVDEKHVVSPERALRRPYNATLSMLSVGRLEPEKDPLLLPGLLADLRAADPRWRLVVCGEGPLEDELRVALDALGLAEHAEVRGYVPFGDLMGVYRESHALIHTSRTEGLPHVFYEAFAAGLPVVATGVGGVGSALGHAVELFEPGNPSQAAAALQRIAANEGLRTRLIRAGHDLITHHTIERESGRVAQFIHNPDDGAKL